MKAWALVDKNTKEIDSIEFSRSIARYMKTNYRKVVRCEIKLIDDKKKG